MSNQQNLKLPISFDNVTYFKNTYLGDLIVTPEILYYFPHTNVEAVKNAHWNKLNPYISHFGLLGGIVGSSVIGAIRLSESRHLSLKVTINCSRLKEKKLWLEKDDSKQLQKRLDEHINEVRKEKIKTGEFDLPMPMRFIKSEVKNMILNSKLRFDTQFDNHDFIIGFPKRKLLRDALWMAGFLR